MTKDKLWTFDSFFITFIVFIISRDAAYSFTNDYLLLVSNTDTDNR